MPIADTTQAPNPITAPPQAPTASHTREQFVPLAFAFMQWQAALREGANALAQNVYHNAQKAHGFATQALNGAGDAQEAKAAAEAAAALAAAAPTANGTSASSIAIAAGAVTLITQPGRAFVAGQYVVIARTAAPAAQRLWGTVTGYDGQSGQLEVQVNHTAGSGTHTGWQISIAAPPAVAALPTQRIVANTAAAPGIHYVLAAAGITLQMPAAPVLGACVAFTNAAAGAVTVDWGGRTVMGVAPAPQAMRIPPRGHAAVMYDGHTWVILFGIGAAIEGVAGGAGIDTSALQQALNDAAQQKQQAQNAALNAAGAATAAAEQRDQAISAAGTANTAAGQAVQARDAAENAAGDAVSAKSAAESAATRAENALAAAEQARNAAQQAAAGSGGAPAIIGLSQEVLLDAVLGAPAEDVADCMPALVEATNFAPVVRIGNATYKFTSPAQFTRDLKIIGKGTLKFAGLLEGNVGTYQAGRELIRFEGRDKWTLLEGVTLDFGAGDNISLGTGLRLYNGMAHLEDVTVKNLHCNNPTGLAIGVFAHTMRQFSYRKLRLENITCLFTSASTPGVNGLVQGVSILSAAASDPNFTDTLHLNGLDLAAKRVYSLDADGNRAPRGGNALVVAVGPAVNVYGQIDKTAVADTGNRAVKLNTYGRRTSVQINGVHATSPWTEEDDARFPDASMWSVVSAQYGGNITINNVTGVGGSIAVGVEIGGTPIEYQRSGGALVLDAHGKPIVTGGGEGVFLVDNLIFEPRVKNTTRKGGTYAVTAEGLPNGELHLGAVSAKNCSVALLASNVKKVVTLGGKWEARTYPAMLYHVDEFESNTTDWIKSAGGTWGVIALAGKVPKVKVVGGTIAGFSGVETPFYAANTPWGPTVLSGTSRNWVPSTVQITCLALDIKQTIGTLVSTDVPPPSSGGAEPVQLSVGQALVRHATHATMTEALLRR